MYTVDGDLGQPHAGRWSQRPARPRDSKSRPCSSRPADRWYVLGYGCTDGRRCSRVWRRTGLSTVVAMAPAVDRESARARPRHHKSHRRRPQQRVFDVCAVGRPEADAQAPRSRGAPSAATALASLRHHTPFIAFRDPQTSSPTPYEKRTWRARSGGTHICSQGT